MQADQAADAGLDMNPRQLEVLRDSEGGQYLNLKGDPSTVAMFCYGTAVPVVTNDDGQGRASFTYCPTWQRRRERDLAGEDALFDASEVERVAMGVSSLGAEDPWRAARAGLDELAPKPAV